MAFSPQLAHRAQTDEDWSGFAFGEIRSAVDTALALSLSPPGGQAEYDSWKKRCKSKVDYLFYLFSSNTVRIGVPDGDLEIADVLAACEAEKLDQWAKRNFLACYLNTYFYRFITEVEVPKIRGFISTNPDFSTTEAVEYCVTQLLYSDVVEVDPGVFFTFGDIDGVPAQRLQELRALSSKIANALEQGDASRDLLEGVFLVMTRYVGSDYRRVHAAVTGLLGG
jgi:hypothetical protein